MGRSLQVSQQQTPSLEQHEPKIGLNSSPALNRLHLCGFLLSADGDQEQLASGLADGNRVAAFQAGHQLVKREAGRGRGKSCKGKRCNNKKKKAEKGKKRTQKDQKWERRGKKKQNSKK